MITADGKPMPTGWRNGTETVLITDGHDFFDAAVLFLDQQRRAVVPPEAFWLRKNRGKKQSEALVTRELSTALRTTLKNGTARILGRLKNVELKLQKESFKQIDF